MTQGCCGSRAEPRPAEPCPWLSARGRQSALGRTEKALKPQHVSRAPQVPKVETAWPGLPPARFSLEAQSQGRRALRPSPREQAGEGGTPRCRENKGRERGIRAGVDEWEENECSREFYRPGRIRRVCQGRISLFFHSGSNELLPEQVPGPESMRQVRVTFP